MNNLKKEVGFLKHGRLLHGLVWGMHPKNVLELGCGISSLAIVQALQENDDRGMLFTVDTRTIQQVGHDESLLNEYAKYWGYIQGNSLDIVPRFPENYFDIVLHDGSHEWRTVVRDIWNIVSRMKKNGILLVHDTCHPVLGRGIRFALWLGLLFTKHEKMTIPYGFGLTIIRIK